MSSGTPRPTQRPLLHFNPNQDASAAASSSSHSAHASSGRPAAGQQLPSASRPALPSSGPARAPSHPVHPHAHDSIERRASSTSHRDAAQSRTVQRHATAASAADGAQSRAIAQRQPPTALDRVQRVAAVDLNSRTNTHVHVHTQRANVAGQPGFVSTVTAQTVTDLTPPDARYVQHFICRTLESTVPTLPNSATGRLELALPATQAGGPTVVRLPVNTVPEQPFVVAPSGRVYFDDEESHAQYELLAGAMTDAVRDGRVVIEGPVRRAPGRDVQDRHVQRALGQHPDRRDPRPRSNG